MNTIRALLSALALACAAVASAQEPKQEPEMTIDQVTEFIRKYNEDYITPMSERREMKLYGDAVRRENLGALKQENGIGFSKCRETAYALYRRGEQEKIPSLRHALFAEARRFACEGKDEVMGRLATSRLGGGEGSLPPVNLKSLETKAEAQLLVDWCLRMDGEFSALKRYDIARRYIAVAREAAAYVKSAAEVLPRIQEREKALEELAKTVVEKYEDGPALPDGPAPEIELKNVSELPEDAGGTVPAAVVLVRKRVDGHLKSKLYVVRQTEMIGDGDLATQCRVIAITKADAEAPEKAPSMWELRYRDSVGREKTIRLPPRR